MVIEGDDGRPRVARAASATRCSSRYAWPRCIPSNTPTTTKIGPRPGAARRSLRRRASRVSRPAPAAGSGATKTLSGASRPPAAVAMATRSRRHRAADSARPGRAGRPAGRTNWPRATAATSSAVSVTTGNASSPVSSGWSTGRRPSGLSAAAARMSSSGRAVSSVNGPRRGPGQRRRGRRRSRAARRGRVPAPGRTCRPSTRRR